ncbi:MinD/ParA family protein [Deferribacter autotrophicus]|uniref:MinD/ParA family protein n=1 Tax=Deferribacter autotrophicus TaxID=500465 RepID=A0A5A8F196_9BACT|nr:MinD/ParA family protein [Deferribacter autotrophicus]KAA0257116.1 MinD/ParA family protein [Deferribacter autotrophicus]
MERVVTDQAGLLRKMAWAKNRKSIYISVSSGKGGVGKTNFAVNLAYQLVRRGKKVLLFDADLGLANVDVILNIAPMKTVKDFILNNAKVDEIIIKNVKGIDVFPASSGFMELAHFEMETFEKILDMFVMLDKSYDYIIFDTAAGIAENVLRFVLFSDLFIVITLPEPTAITDAYALIKVVHNKNKAITPYFVINMVKGKDQAETVYENLKKVIINFLKKDVKLLGFIRRDEKLVKAVTKQKILSEVFPMSEYAKDLNKIADNVLIFNDKNRSINMEEFFVMRG